MTSRSAWYSGPYSSPSPGSLAIERIIDILQFERIQSGIVGCQQMPPKPASSDLLQGTLDLLVLKTLSLESMHGWGIAQRIRQVSGEVFAVNQGSLYPALARLEQKGWVTGGD